LKAIRSKGGSSEPYDFVEINGLAYLIADNGNLGRELWRTDNTAAGTWLGKDNLGTDSSNPASFTAVGSSQCSAFLSGGGVVGIDDFWYGFG
jgi:ELWxxDGT repeat protein